MAGCWRPEPHETCPCPRSETTRGPAPNRRHRCAIGFQGQQNLTAKDTASQEDGPAMAPNGPLPPIWCAGNSLHTLLVLAFRGTMGPWRQRLCRRCRVARGSEFEVDAFFFHHQRTLLHLSVNGADVLADEAHEQELDGSKKKKPITMGAMPAENRFSKSACKPDSPPLLKPRAPRRRTP